MTSVKSHGILTVGTVSVRRKPALTSQSPAQNSAVFHPEKTLFTAQSATAAAPPSSPPIRLSQMPELSQRSTVTHKPSRHHMTTPLLPLYHPFGTLALSLPDLDPTVFGLPAPVAVFDDPTRRSNRQRRPAAKVREADDAPTPLVAATSTPEPEVREKSSPRRRRGGGPGGKRKRREPEDGDATYPAKRLRNPRSSGIGSGLSGTRGISREEGSPALSNAHSGVSPAAEVGRGEGGEERKPERRTTRSRGAITRRDSTASEVTTTSPSPSVSATNTVVPRVASSGESMETDEPAGNEGSNEGTATGAESNKIAADDNPMPEQDEN